MRDHIDDRIADADDVKRGDIEYGEIIARVLVPLNGKARSIGTMPGTASRRGRGWVQLSTAFD